MKTEESKRIEKLEEQVRKLEQDKISLIKEVRVLKNKSSRTSKTVVNKRNAGRKKTFSEEEKISIARCRNEGKTFKQIASEYGCSVGLVHNLVKKMNEKGDNRMRKETEIFEAHELHNLCTAQYHASEMSEETGIGSHWTEFTPDLEQTFNELSEYEKDEFEDRLLEATERQKSNIDSLMELKESDFDSFDEFWEERKLIQERITAGAIEVLGKYYKQDI